MVIFIALSIPLINLVLIKNFKIVSIFFLMRLLSAFSNRKNISSKWFLISYLFYIPELITGPYRNISDWKIPNINIKRFNVQTLSLIFFYLNIILCSGLFYSYLINQSNLIIYKAFITHLFLYVQFSSACNIINLINECFEEKRIENFDKPLFAKSVNDFWNRWHITLGSFSRQNIAQPISFLLRKKGYEKTFAYICSTFLAFLFIGLWHKFSLSYLYYGLYFSVFVVLEKTNLFKNFQGSIPVKFNSLVFILYCQIIVVFSYTFILNDISNVIIHP